MFSFFTIIFLPVDVVLDPIDDLSELAEIAEQPMTEAQKISMAFVIFQNTGKFKSDLKLWNRKPDADKNWMNMKTHFREAFQEIRDVKDTPAPATFDQENGKERRRSTTRHNQETNWHNLWLWGLWPCGSKGLLSARA